LAVGHFGIVAAACQGAPRQGALRQRGKGQSEAIRQCRDSGGVQISTLCKQTASTT